MRLREQGMPMDPEVERELAAIEAGLVGMEVAPDLEPLAELARDTRAERHAPEPDFAAQLDEWAAAGFPRAARPAHGDEEEGESALARIRDRLQAVPPRRLLAPVAGVATLLVAVAVGISVSDQIGRSGGAPEAGPTNSAGSGGGGQAAPAQNRGRRIPEARDLRQLQPKLDTPFVQGGNPNIQYGTAAAAGSPGAIGSVRKVAQNADLVLSTDPQNVRHVADGVVQVVDRYHGYVVSSDVTSGRTPGPVPLEGDASRSSAGQEGSGRFELRIPAGKLQPALADLSGLAHVTSRTEGVVDVTKRFDSAQQQVDDLEVQRTHLLRQLADAFTLTEQQSIKQRLAIVEQQLAGARNHLGHVQQRIHLVPVSVEVLGQKGIDKGDGGGGGWSVGDAFHDAGRVLTVIAGILLISAAVLGPIALLVALGWFGARVILRLRRERALD